MGPSGVLFFREKRFMELDMTKGSPSKLITKFIIPIIIGNIFQQLYSMVDTIIVGRFIGVDALAAVGATGSVSFLILGFTQGLTTGFTVLTAQRFGAGDREGMRKSIGDRDDRDDSSQYGRHGQSASGDEYSRRYFRYDEGIHYDHLCGNCLQCIV